MHFSIKMATTELLQKKILACWFCLSLVFSDISHAIPINNGVEDKPYIECNSDSISVNFFSQNPFHGRLFVKGQSHKETCVEDFTHFIGSSMQSKSSKIRVNFGTCNVEKQRKTQPKGIYMRTTVVIQFHPIFLTKIDRAYHVRCFYQESDKTVQQELEVSMLTTKNVQTAYPMPICTYSVRQGSYEGPRIRFLRVGDPVFHRWECKGPVGHDINESAYGMLVHSCFVDDGTGNKVALIDSNGCGIDPYILGHPTYSRNLLQAYREAHVFKFADKNLLAFSCQIRLCFKNMDTCDGMTPPKCSQLKNKRSLTHPFSQNWNSGNFSAILPVSQDFLPESDLESFDVQTREFVVFDADEWPDQRQDSDLVPSKEQREVCIGHTTAGALWVCMGLFCIAIITLSLILTKKDRTVERVSTTNLKSSLSLTSPRIVA